MRIQRNLRLAALAVALGGTPATAAGNTAYALPVSGIAVDGDLSDWPQDGVEIPVATTGAIYGGHPDLLGQDLTTSPDLSATFRVGYDAGQDLIYLAVRVRDDALVTGTSWTRTDASEIYLGGAGPVRQYYMVPGEGAYGAGYENPGLKGVEWSRTRAQAAWRRSGDVTTYEWAVEAFGRPGSPLDLKPGLSLPFDVAVADRDDDDDLAWVTWGPYIAQKFGSPSRVGTLVLLAPGEPLASLTGSVSLTGHQVQARDGDRVVGAAPVRADGTFEMHVPPGPYRLTVDDDETLALAATPVMAQTGGAPAQLAAALVCAGPPSVSDDTATGGAASDPALHARLQRESTMETVAWIIFIVGVFTVLIHRQIVVNRTRQMAIQAGRPLAEPRASDPRKMALILIALGAGFAIAIGTTLALVPDHDAPPPLAVAIWGLVPALLGGALWAYRELAAGEKR